MTDSESSGYSAVVQTLKDLMPRWGYSTQENEWAALRNVTRYTPAEADGSHAQEADYARNPWTSVW